ncbi:MAG TPA: hypothetical protein VGK73_03025 [Polyangiaceae bacterium]
MTGIYWEPRPREGAPCPRCASKDTLILSKNLRKGFRHHVCKGCGKTFQTKIQKKL